MKTQNVLRQEADRIAEDFKHGGKLGAKSTERLIELMQRMAGRLDYLEEVRRLRHGAER